MEKIMIINASPRAPKSNSQKYAALFEQYSRVPTQYFNLTKKNHADLCSVMKDFSDLLFVFPLYADGIPSTLLGFLKSLQEYPLQHKPVVSVLINCGFIEPEQNDVAVEMVRLFCEENGYPFKNREWRGNSCNAVSISGTTQNKKIGKMRGNTPQTKLTCHDAHYQKNVSSGIYHILGELRQEKRHYKRANGMYAD